MALRLRDGSARMDRTPMGTGFIKDSTKSSDGSEAKGCWLWKIREKGSHVDPYNLGLLKEVVGGRLS